MKKIEKVLVKYAIQAGQCAKGMQRRGLKRTDKGGGDFATAADLKSEQILLRGLRKELPHIPIISEEQKLPATVPPECIVCDPVDGTIIYAHGCRDWGVSVCYLYGGEPVVGVMVAPSLDRIVVARKGGGCTVNGKKVRLKAPNPGERYLAAFDICHATDIRYLDRVIKPLMRKTMIIRSLGTAVGSTLELLEGKVSAYIAPKGGKVWDFAAAALAVEESGGAVLAPDGSKVRWDKIPVGVILATDKKLCRNLVALTKKSGVKVG